MTGEEHGRGILSEADRAYLRGEKELTQGAERNTRQRIRERVQASLHDYRLLWSMLPDNDLEQIFYPDDGEHRHEIRASTQQALSFLLLGLWANRDPHGGRVEDAVEQAAYANHWVVDADLKLTVEEAPTGNLLIAKMKDREQRIEELLSRMEEENLSETKEKELEEKLRTEASLQYYLFEKGLSDPSVDAEEFSELNLIGDDIELEPEDVEKTQAAREQSPITRRTMPSVVNIEHKTESEMEETIETMEDGQGNKEDLDVSEVDK